MLSVSLQNGRMLQLLRLGADRDHRAIFMGAKGLQEVYNSLLFSFSFYSSRLWGTQLLGPDFKDKFSSCHYIKKIGKIYMQKWRTEQRLHNIQAKDTRRVYTRHES